jgi:hypothetical protein
MANVLNRTTGNSGVYPYAKDYRTSVNDPDYPTADWIHNPDLSAVAGFDSIYWDISGDSVTLADQVTRDARDADIAAQRQLADNQQQKDAYTDNQLFRAQIKYVVDEINILRSNAGLTPARTYAEAQQYMFDAIDNGEV